jgi:hypothetical protein
MLHDRFCLRGFASFCGPLFRTSYISRLRKNYSSLLTWQKALYLRDTCCKKLFETARRSFQMRRTWKVGCLNHFVPLYAQNTRPCALEGSLTSLFNHLSIVCRMVNEPVQYIIGLRKKIRTKLPCYFIPGEWEFYTLTLKVKPPVLIPRPETEQLVARILTDLNEFGATKDPIRILDVGSGTGLLKKFRFFSIKLLNIFPRMHWFGSIITFAK